MTPLLRIALLCCGVPGTQLWAQPCTPYFADMGTSPYSFSESYFTVFDDGSGATLYRGDYLNRILVRWGPTGWQPVTMAGAPAGFEPIAPRVLDRGTGSEMYVSGQIDSVEHLLRWTGQQWEPSGICYGGTCPGFRVAGGLLMAMDLGHGPQLYARGYRHLSGDTFVVRWDATQWTEIGAATNRNVKSLVPYDDGTGLALYAIGDFSMFSGIAAEGMVKWNGQTWAAATPAQNRVRARWWALVADLGDGPAIYTDAEVLINGEFVGGANKWDGQQWTHLGRPDGPNPGYVLAGAVFDDGRGPGLYIGGQFTSYGGMTARNVVRYTPAQSFEALGAGIMGEVSRLHPFQDQRGPALYVGGDGLFGAGGGTLRQSGVLWVGCPNCYANCDLSDRAPTLNVSDFICFINKFAARDPYANCTGDAVIDIADFSCFLSKFAQGCP